MKCVWQHAPSRFPEHSPTVLLWRPTCIQAVSGQTEHSNMNHFDFGCEVSPIEFGYRYCPFCSGEIEVKEKLDG